MKDLGKLLDINVDSNQRIMKDSTKPLEFYGDEDAVKNSKKQPKPSPKKKPTGISPGIKRFKKTRKALNVEKIPGSN